MTGGRGRLGRRVVTLLRGGGVDVRAGTRSPCAPGEVELDLTTGRGLEQALEGCETVIHCATDARHHRQVDRDGTERLLEAAAAIHVVYPGIVGADRVPWGYYESKTAAESAVAGHPSHAIVRSTQFHEFVWWALERLARPPIMVVPNDTRLQPIDIDVVARAVADAAGGPAAPIELAGPHQYRIESLARSYLAATGKHRPLLKVNLPGITGAALRAGALLADHSTTGGRSWNDFVADQMQRRDDSQERPRT